jgi:hypothetical protein
MKRAAVPSILVAVVLLAVGVTTEAQQPKKVSRLGYLSGLDPASESTRSEAIRMALRELGYIDGQNIAFEYRYAEGKRDRQPELAAELVHLKVDIIVESSKPFLGTVRWRCSTRRKPAAILSRAASIVTSRLSGRYGKPWPRRALVAF